MNGISASGLTASSILSGRTDIAPKAAASESASAAAVFTEDTVVKSEKEDISFKKPGFFKIDDSKNPFKKLTEEDIDAAKTGAFIGAAVGGIAGGVAAYNMSWNEIKSTNDVNSVTLDWQEPVMQKEVLGEMPADYYGYSSWDLGHPHGTQDVVKNNPVLEHGQPVMKDVSKTYSDYGTPVVSWKDNAISHKTMTGYHSSITPDVHTYETYEGTDSEGNAIYSTHQEIEGYWHSFYPDIKSDIVGSYKTPSVKFETGVNVGLNTALGVLAGAGLGAVTGGIAGAAISHAMNR